MFLVAPADAKQLLVSESVKVSSGTPYHGKVLIDMTIGRFTEFQFSYQGSPITVNLTTPSGLMVNVHKEDDVNAFVFKPEGQTEVNTIS